MSKVIVITGASSGLGLSLSKKFVASGAMVLGLSKTKKHWKAAHNTIGRQDHFQLFQIDLTKEPEVRKFFSGLIKKFGTLDLVINNAGYGGKLVAIDQLPLSEFQNHIDSNLYSAFFVCKHSIPIFRKQKNGYIINISSMAGKRAVPKLAAYSASKFGVVALSQCVAKENAEFNLKCITVCPGGMNTEMRATLFGQTDAEAQQSPDFVADVIYQIYERKIEIDSGGDVIIRHGKITINSVPAA